MQYVKYGKAVAVVALLLSATLAANANIFIDENFEGQTVFTDLNYPIRDDTTSPTEANIAATQGINVRALDDAQAAPPVLSISNTGTVTSVMAYHGTKCLQLASGQSVSVPSLYTNAGMNWYQVMQFATIPPRCSCLPAHGSAFTGRTGQPSDRLAPPPCSIS